MVRKNERKYRKASSGKSSGCYDVDSYQSLSYNRLPEDRKTYASKVKSLIEKKHRSVGSYKKTSALRQVLSTFPKNVTKCWDDDEDGETFRKSDSEFEYDDPDLEEVYESQKLNFRRMISNLSKHIYEDSDFDSWSDLESNFSLIYEPSSSVSSQQPTGSPLWCHGPDDLDDVNLTLEKVKNLKNVYNTEDARKNGSTTVSFDSKKKTSTTWEFSCSSCDSWSYCTSSSCDTTSFLSTCSYCRTFQTVKESNVYIGCDNNPQYITSKNVINNNKNNIISQTSRNVTRAASSVKLNRHDSWTNSECSQTYEPISVGRMLWSSRIKQLKRKLRVNSFSKRSSEDYCDSWSHYSNFTSLPISTMSRTALKQDCHDGVFGRNEAQTSREWESVENVSLGLIYIPMDAPKAINVINKGVLPEFQLSKCPSPSESTFSKDTICDSPLQIGVSPFTKDNSHHIHSAVEVDGEDTVSGRSDDFDPFGSLESLIFEPKEVVFPEAIGRDNKLKASISISNISNRSVSEDDGQSTVTQHSERENEEPVSDSGLPPSLSQTKSSVMSSSGKCYGTSKSSLNSVGSYWDWGKNASVTTKSVQGVKKAELGNHQPEESQYVQREPAGNKEMDTDSSFASEQPRSSELSDSKTCAGTSVASWTYIGLSKVANGTGAIIGIGRPEEEGEADVNGDGAKTIDDSSSTSPCASFRTGISPKKEVTWKIISEQRNKDGLSELVCTAPSFQEHVPCKVIPSVAPLKGVAMPPSHLMDFYNCWSDLESLIFADESCQSTLASVRDVVIGKKCGATSLGHVGNRMNSYKDDWLFWDQQRKRRKMMLPNEDFTWRNKAKRMLLWMHYSQGDGGSPMEQWTWWKVKGHKTCPLSEAQ